MSSSNTIGGSLGGSGTISSGLRSSTICSSLSGSGAIHDSSVAINNCRISNSGRIDSRAINSSSINNRRICDYGSRCFRSRLFHNLGHCGRLCDLISSLRRRRTKEVHMGEENHHSPRENQTDQPHDNTRKRHTARIRIARRMRKGVRRSRNREAHAERASKRNGNEESGHATEANEVVLASDAHSTKNRNQKRSRRGMAHEIRHEQANDTAADHESKRRPACKRDRLDKVSGKASRIEANTQGKTTSHEPEHVPAHRIQILLGNHAGKGKHGHRDHCNRVIVNTVNVLARHPQKHTHDKGNVNNDSLGARIELAGTFNIQDHLFHLDRVNLHEQEPSNYHQNNHVRNTEGHPLAEGHRVRDKVTTGNGIVQGTKGDGVRRRTDRGTHTTDVGTERNSKGKSSLTAIVFVKELEHRGEDGKHHGCGSGIAHEHREHSRNEHEAEEHELRVLAEGLQEHAGQVQVHLVLGGGGSKEEPTQEEHDDGVCKGRHDGLVANHRHTVHAERGERRIGHRDNHEHDDKHRGGPDRERLQDPEKSGHDENADDADFERVQGSHGACGIESEGFVGQEESGDGEHRRNNEFDEFCLCHSAPKSRKRP